MTTAAASVSCGTLIDQPEEPVPDDPTVTDPDLYRVAFENDRVRVLEYHDRPGDGTHPHAHPDSVMVTLTSFSRRLHGDGRQVDVDLEAGLVRWLDAQEHAGENIGTTETHAIFVELKDPQLTRGRADADPPAR